MTTRRERDELQQAEDVIRARPVILTTVVSVVVTVLLVLVAYVLLRAREAQLGARFEDRDLPAPHARSQVLAEPFNIPYPRPAFNARNRPILDGWGWVDRQRRIVHVPVGVAMDLVLQEAEKK